VARVKICGLCRPEDACEAVMAGADYLGFVFAGGPRRVAPEHAAEILRALPPGAQRAVGVFVDASVAEVLAVRARAPIRVVQLHGDEAPEACRTLREAGLEVWKAFRPRNFAELGTFAERYREVADGLLVEGYSARAPGGTGTRLPAELWPELRRAAAGRSLVLAGGLAPDNVAAAVRAVAPDVVDVSSGVERVPGEKDAKLVRSFVRAVRDAATRESAAGGGERRLHAPDVSDERSEA